MSRSADAPTRTGGPLLLCAVGLFFTVVVVTGFGFDFANDTAGFVLVGIGAARLSGAAAGPWRLLTVVSAGLAALVSLFTYGGPAGQLLSLTYRLWNAMFYLDTVATAGVVTGLLMVTWTLARSPAPARWQVRALPVLAGGYVLVVALSMVLFANQSAYSGTLGHLRQVVGIVIGAVHSLTVVAAFVSVRRCEMTRAPR